MPLNDTGMALVASLLQETLLYAQLHSASAGDGGDNIALEGRQPVPWGTPDSGGDFGLASAITFTGGDPSSDIYSVTLWDEETDGICYGEYVLSEDASFNADGEYHITALDFNGTVTGA